MRKSFQNDFYETVFSFGIMSTELNAISIKYLIVENQCDI